MGTFFTRTVEFVHVTQLTTYPLKSAGGLYTASATVTRIGLQGDRRWVALDPQGRRISARECHALLGIKVTATEAGLRLTSRSGDACEVAEPGPDARHVPVQVSRLDQLALAAPAASRWLSENVGRDLRLAFQVDETAREVGASHGGKPGERMSLADAGPILLVSESSVDRICDLVVEESGEQWLTRAEATQRFRPNVVVNGTEPFGEDSWQRIRIGDLTYRFGEQCDRCVMTTLDPQTLTTDKEPIRTLARHRAWAGSTWLGVRLIPELGAGQTGDIALGAQVEVLERRSPLS